MHRIVTEFITHGSTCTFLVRYMKDLFHSPTAIMCIGLHGLSPNPCIPWVRRSLLALPHIAAWPRALIRQSPLTRFPYKYHVICLIVSRKYQLNPHAFISAINSEINK